ncbi:MAG TPA: YigZ family protein [Bacilli bacterium]|nr:YigZ family protein [Bacilli bacterium]HPZ23679.1 YigZ family protein [Bacilli bacterium]HQC83438.1 YigZ family protein [Bacilli bacterium]
MKLINSYTYEIKKSKFIGYLYEVNSLEEIKIILSNLKKEHKKARHMPYAYKIGNLIHKTDDKEPSNTAGLPIYNLIMNRDLDNVLIVIVRYFGGIKLGAGPLMRSYNKTSIELLNIKGNQS